MKTVGIALLLLGLCVGCTETGNQRADQVGNTAVGQSFARAKDGVCASNLSQVRQLIAAAKANQTDEEEPITWDSMRTPESLRQCPIGKEPYNLNPAEDTVKCPHLGHEKY